MPGETNQVLWRGVQPVAGIRGIWPAIGATRVTATKSVWGVLTDIVYTVPAGKILFVSSGALASSMSTADAHWTGLGVRNVGDVIQYYLIRHHFGTIGHLSGLNPYVPAVEVAAGWDVFAISNHLSLFANAIINGWLEDA